MFPSCQYGQGQCSLVWKLYQIYDNKDDGDDDEDGSDDDMVIAKMMTMTMVIMMI